MTNINTLPSLFSNFKVEIPIIQRDYAQGRDDEHACIVRKNLLQDIKDAISKGHQLDLNFVYGKAQEGTFIPLDGQQRLTTLFLLYLYAFAHDESQTKFLEKFTYKTRASSRNFLEDLVLHRSEIFASEKPSEVIRDAAWFLQSWEYDPTIQSALTMLDDIRDNFHDVHDLASNLLEHEPLTFQFLEISNLGMEDNLYLKLNARGKSLSAFENFKARFVDRLKEVCKQDCEFINIFELRLDNEWTDIFWKQKQEKFDLLYLNFFREVLHNASYERNNFSKPDTSMLEGENWYHTFDYIHISKNEYETASYTLDFLQNHPDKQEIKDIVFNPLDEHRSYKNRVLFYAMAKYFHVSKGGDEKELQQWLRVIKNLTLNTDIDTEDRYLGAIQSVNNIVKHQSSLLEFLADEKKVSFFSQKQVGEEQIKAQLILEDDDFAKAIYAAEEHAYFKGQIRSALNLCIDDDGYYDLEEFTQYWNKIANLFDTNKARHDHLLRRALLCFADFTLPVGHYQTLCVNDPDEAQSNPSLKRLFSDHPESIRDFLSALKITEDFGEQMKAIIQKSSVPETDWRYYFIKYKDLFEWMNPMYLRLRYVEDTGIWLIVPNKTSSGENHHLYLAALYCSLVNEDKIKETMELYSPRGMWAKDHSLIFKDGRFRIQCRETTFELLKTNKLVFATSTDNPFTEVRKYLLKLF